MQNTCGEGGGIAAEKKIKTEGVGKFCFLSEK